MEKFSFKYGQQFGLETGGIVTMKSLITIDKPEYKIQFIECIENNKLIPVSQLLVIKK
jgi:hypothetical protein